MTDIEKAKQSLAGHTIALCKGGDIVTSDKRGIAPMLGFIAENQKIDTRERGIFARLPQPRSRTEFCEESGDSRLQNFFDLHRAAQKIRIRVCRFSEKIFFVGQYGEKGGVYARKHARKSERLVSAEIYVHADSRIAARFHVLFHFG